MRICFSTLTGTGNSSLNTADTTSPEIPEPPMPSTTMLRTVSAFGNASAGTIDAASCAAASCSGSPATAPRKFSESLAKVRLHTVGFRLLGEASVLGVVDRFGIVDQHVGDVAVEHAVTPLQTRVVQRVLVGEVQERALVVGAREDLEQFGVERH